MNIVNKNSYIRFLVRKYHLRYNGTDPRYTVMLYDDNTEFCGFCMQLISDKNYYFFEKDCLIDPIYNIYFNSLFSIKDNIRSYIMGVRKKLK